MTIKPWKCKRRGSLPQSSTVKSLAAMHGLLLVGHMLVLFPKLLRSVEFTIFNSFLHEIGDMIMKRELILQ